MARVGSRHGKEMMKERLYQHQVGKKDMVSKKWVNTINLHSSLEFSKLCFTTEAKNNTV